jgi:hypothetical protein
MSIKGGMDAANASEEMGRRQKEAADFEAAQLNQNAGQAIASSQRQALEERRKSALMQSRALALAASSGAGTTDPTVVNLISNMAGEGVYRAGVALYEGEDRARAMRLQAEATQYSGNAALAGGNNRASAYRTQGVAGALGSVSMFAKYGAGGPSNVAATGGANLLDAGITNPMIG